MTRLILIRHAKSDWGTPFSEDHARPLTKRGRSAAAVIGRWMQSNGYQPDLILSSDATRTRETCDHLLPHLADTPQIAYRADLYHPGPDVMLSIIAAQAVNCLAIVSHNPGIAILASILVQSAPNHPRFDDYPTCATTIIDFDGQVAPGMGRCRDFVVPRDLMD